MLASMGMAAVLARRGAPLVVARCGLLLATIAGFACYDFHLTGPEDPPAVPPALVSVSIEYRQPAGCNNTPAQCDNPVVFFGSWMHPGAEFALQRDTTGRVWRGTALSVPANFPPADEPYEVRIFDPHLAATPTGGFTGNRLTVGRQLLERLASLGTPREAALVYVDVNGEGHNPF